ncbi:carboxypeptidase-like regulatory domain-containing protein [Armatimonas rosea]|uniref:Carboxypeptidase regulatory-like domain-containing protein n=1 Tax=Armatimonas rosea TaxID=685828 RepID=A0A7W9SVU9_ARMRO|nr:carboxypeptidase-like regulatory domain-containing protein [Armatimonas rosea]MBB6052918.1 hypothetical protein [Armatimonas rosea]
MQATRQRQPTQALPRIISGSVCDPQGKPVPTARVFVQYGTTYQGYSGPGGERGVGDVVEVHPDPQGHFRFTELPATYDTITVFAQRPGGPLITLERGGLRFGGTPESPFDAPFDLVLPDSGATLTATFLTPEGKPSAGRSVVLGIGMPALFYPGQGNQRVWKKEPQLTLLRLLQPTQTTDSQGRVRFTGLLPNNYTLGEKIDSGFPGVLARGILVPENQETRVVFRLPKTPQWGADYLAELGRGWAFRLGNAVGSGMSGAGSGGFQLPPQARGVVTIWNRGDSELEPVGWRQQATVLVSSLVPLEGVARFSRVWHGPGQVRVKVVDAQGKPRAGVTVTMAPRGTATSNADGEALFTEVPEGRYNIVSGGALGASRAAQSVTVSAGERTECRLVLDPKKVPQLGPSPEQRKQLEEWGKAPKRTVTLRCETLDGRPLGGVAVGVRGFPRFSSLRSDARGQLPVASLRADQPVTVELWCQGWEGELTLPPGVTEARAVLKPRAFLTGQVTLAGKPLSRWPAGQVVVRAVAETPSQGVLVPGLTQEATPQADGRFAFDLAPGTYKLQATVDNLWKTPERTVRWDGKSAPLTLDIPMPGLPMTVAVRDKAGKALPSVRLEPAPPEVEFRTDEAGQVTLAGLVAGRHTLKVVGRSETVTVTVPPALK